MRNVLLVALVGIIPLSALGCGDASSSNGTLTRRPGAATTAAPSGDHDPTDEGDQTPDPGNPNADIPPSPPESPGQTTGELGVTVDNATPAVDLGEQVEIAVTVAPKAGFKGEATLTIAGLPEGATATFAPAKVTLNTTAVSSKLTLKALVTAVPSAPGASAPLVVSAGSGAISATANASFKINPRMKLTIPVNLDALRSTGTKFIDQWGPAFGANPQSLQTQAGNGIVVTVFNADSKGHIIHGNNGFQHGATTYTDANGAQQVALIPPGAYEPSVAGNPASAPRTRTLNPGANVTGYPHEGGAGTSVGFRIQVQAAP